MSLRELTSAAQQPAEPEVVHAREAGLVYVTDATPGISRVNKGRGFRYLKDALQVRDPKTIDRIRALAIPPAWTDVWICPHATGHLQAVGRDDKGRKQYIYHPEWRRIRDFDKYDRVLEFARILPGLRARVARDMHRRGISKEKVLATIVYLLDRTQIRVGNSHYAKQNGSFGLTTLRNRHLSVDGHEVRFNFKGKSGRIWRLNMKDRRIARIIKSLQELPGQQLFQYVADDGTLKTIDSTDVNEYLRAATGEDITAKDFRTWAGTLIAAVQLSGASPPLTQAAAKSAINSAVKFVAAKLGNTVSVCRKCYIHPDIFARYSEGKCAELIAAGLDDVELLHRAERHVIRLLRSGARQRRREAGGKA